MSEVVEPGLRHSAFALALAVLLGMAFGFSSEAAVCTTNLDGVSGFTSFAGVGFQQNVAARLSGTLNGQPDNQAGNYHAEIDWESKGQFQAADLVALGNGTFLVKGSHNYPQQGTYRVQVKASGSCGNTVGPKVTTTVSVAPMPSSFPGTPPDRAATSRAPGNVIVNVNGVSGFTSFAGVGFQQNLVARVSASFNNQPDNEVGGYRAQVNWGDSDTWTPGDLVLLGNGDYLVKAKHVYAQQGTYPIVVYVSAPDGTSAAARTTTVTTVPMPSGIPGTLPDPVTPALAPSNVVVNVDGVSGFSAQATVGFENNLVARISGLLRGQPNSAVGDYQAQINWGDGAQWDPGQILSAAGSLTVYGSHIYKTQGTYPVVVYVTGPDGTSEAARTTTVTVTPAPAGTSNPPQSTGTSTSGTTTPPQTGPSGSGSGNSSGNPTPASRRRAPVPPRDTRPKPVICNLKQLAQIVFDRYETGSPIGLIRVTNLRPKTYLLVLSGTEIDINQATGWLEDAEELLTLSSGYRSSVLRALNKALQIDPSLKGARLIIAGHSLGGMVAMNLAADARLRKQGFTPVGVATYGAPIPATLPDQAGIEYKNVVATGDIVPQAGRIYLNVIPIPGSLDPIAAHMIYPDSDSLADKPIFGESQGGFCLSLATKQMQVFKAPGLISAVTVKSERIGEDRMEREADCLAYQALVRPTDASNYRQGYDGIYWDPKAGAIVIGEAKGGYNGQHDVNKLLGTGYGKQQGTIEWAQLAAQRITRSLTTSNKEVRYAELILQAIEKGYPPIRIEVFHTEIANGKAGAFERFVTYPYQQGPLPSGCH
jgi:hypothetical protein